ncbi:MAG TPA: hypothetical protein DCS43_16685 [Verrucomicrobia bacterium]|nr:hypothetical protein [Verrucomicrobiota bacterium]
MEKKVLQAVRFDLNPASKVTTTYRARVGQDVADVTFELLSLPLYAVEAFSSSETSSSQNHDS